MKIIIGCECSGVVRDAFNALGHDAFSCDILPSERPGPHFQQELLELLRMTRGEWDMGIFHPPCDYLTNSAAWAYSDPNFDRYPGIGYHQQVKPGTLTGAARRAAREEAAKFFMALWNCDIPRVCIENPIGYMNTYPGLPCALPGRQIIQPNQFGDDASKATVLWLRGLNPLRGTCDFPPRVVEWPIGSGKLVHRWSNQTDSGQNKLTPSANRASLRAVTYTGPANAMAAQWGGKP